MKHLLPLSALAFLLAGCGSDTTATGGNADNPWASKETKAEAKAEQAKAKHDAKVAKKDAAPVAPAAEVPQYSFMKKKDPAAPAAVKPVEAMQARIAGVRADGGLIAFQRPEGETAAPGDKLVLAKEGRCLLVSVVEVVGDLTIADIIPNQKETPALFVGDNVSCTTPAVDEKKDAAAPAAAPAAPAAGASPF